MTQRSAGSSSFRNKIRDERGPDTAAPVFGEKRDVQKADLLRGPRDPDAPDRLAAQQDDRLPASGKGGFVVLPLGGELHTEKGGLLGVGPSEGSKLTAERCEFEGNTALGGPGGAAVFAVGTTSVISLTNCTFRDGNVVETVGVVGGGAASSFYAEPRLSSCTATANSARRGGAIFCWGSRPEVLNSVLWGNAATYGGEISSFNPSGDPAVSYSCVAGGIAGAGNITDDPLIISAATGNLALLAGSPAIDSGAESGFPDVDILGASRPVDGDLNGQARCDMGAYEVRTVTLQQARLAPAGAFVNTEGGIVSRTFDGYSISERPDRAAGIRVDRTEHLLEPGQRVRVAGVVGTTPDGEKHIQAQGVSAYGFEEVRPLGMAQRALGGADWHYDPVSQTGQQDVEGGAGLNNIGLMVRLWGVVSHAGFGFFCVDDGSGAVDPDGHRGVRVLALWDPLPGVGQQVEVTGISSCVKQDSRLFRVVRAAYPDDVRIMLPVLSVPPGFVLTSGKRVIGNLLVNGGAETGALSGWSIITVSGSDGWTIRGGGAEGARSFLTSYNWCKRSQTVDLGAAGFSAAEMDSIPPIAVSESYQGSWPNYADSYYLLARLSSPSATLSEYNSGVLKAGTGWQQAETAFTDYPVGVRSIYVEDGGDDAEYWAGHYGTAIDAASVIVQPWEPVRVMNMDDADVLEISISVQSGAVSLAHTANVTFTVDDGAADAHMTFSGAVRALNSVLDSLTYTGTGSADTIRIAVSRPGSQSPLEVREIPVMAPG